MIAVLIDLAREDLFLYTAVIALPSIGLGMLALGILQVLFDEHVPRESATDRLERLDREAPKTRPTSSGRKSGRTGVRG